MTKSIRSIRVDYLRNTGGQPHTRLVGAFMLDRDREGEYAPISPSLANKPAGRQYITGAKWYIGNLRYVQVRMYMQVEVLCECIIEWVYSEDPKEKRTTVDNLGYMRLCLEDPKEK